MTITAQSGYSKSEKTASANDNSVSGGGGEILDIYVSDRASRIEFFGSVTTNNTSFTAPPAVVDNSGYSSWENGEKFQGINASGTFLSSGGSLLNGEARIEVLGQTAASDSFSGSVNISSAPPIGVSLGQNSGGVEYDFIFSPSSGGIDYIDRDISQLYSAGIVRYGSIGGKVTDYSGDPIGNEPVSVGESMFNTGPDGNYSVSVPGGVTLTVSAIGESLEYTATGGSSINVDWQFARIEVTVNTPNGDPVKGTRVTIGESTFSTDDDGKVVLDPAEIRSYSVSIGGEIEDVADVQQQGTLYQISVGDSGNESGVSIGVKDENGDSVWGISAIVSGSSISANSGKNGELSLITQQDGTRLLSIGYDDNRFEREDIEVDLSLGQTITGELELEERQESSGY